MNYKDVMKQMYGIDEKKKKKPPIPPEGNSQGQDLDENNIIREIEDGINKEFNLSERVVYDRYAAKPQVSSKMVEMVKRQIKGMEGYKLARVYETKGSYRMVFESESDGCFEISIKEKK